ncbi:MULTISPECIES: ABC transporter ATP-binding protein/permease [unclassified Pseudoalteromonas]|uniref:ABCB family ABC transporter ATP-binding protein/permease n=1 Tax=unclassified Pseudoalteromonas TaxID=194690 RepID=UPI0005A68E88|nr:MULTISPECIES: ABC transporter ATP-binding protein/permease [unclassified Pseudoalteromonas]
MKHGFSTPDPQSNINFAVFKQVIPYLTEYKNRIILAFLCLALAKVASVYLPFILKNTVDLLDEQQSITSPELVLPLMLVAAYGIVRFANVLFSELRDVLFGRVTEHAMRRISLEVYTHIHQLDLEFHLNRKTGGLARDIERGVSGISFVMRFFVFNIGPTILELSFVIGILSINYGIEYALIIIFAVVLYVLFSVKATNWRLKYIKQANLADNQSNTRAVDSLLNFETVKYFNNEKYEQTQYDTDLANWQVARRKNRLSLFILNGGQALIIAMAMTVTLALAAIDVSQKNMTLGDFVLVNAFMMQIFIPLNFLGFVYREIKGSLANIENMFALLSVKSNITEDKDAPDLKLKNADIEFENVSFAYKNKTNTITELSFKIKSGQKVAIVGPSGAGKSTITKLLYRFYDINEGQILISQQNILDYSLESARKQIAIVPQDTVLFNNSILENVRYGRLDATDDEVKQAINDAQLSHFIDSLPDKLNTQVGERGLKLSGGEKQRVAIARSLLKKTPILIFDEATSSLDSHNEAAIMETLRNIATGHTSLVIAHRLSTIIDADEIFYMDKGKIKEQGTHIELLNKNGFYAALWQVQSHKN